MKTLLLLLMLLIPQPITFVTYHIPKGGNFCSESTFKNLGDVKGIDFIVILDSTILIDQGTTEANNAAQKLFGVSFGSNNHFNSWRLTYSIASVINKKIFLRNYMYSGGTNKNFKFALNNQKVVFVDGYASFSGTVRFNRLTNTIILQIPSQNISQEFPFDFSRASTTCYQQFFYWEGATDRGAPWPLTCKISQTYIY